MDSRASTATRLSAFPILIALLLNLLIGPLAPAVQTVLAADPVVTQADDASGCMGVVTTPGSENTTKRYVGGSLEPGGTASFEISYPVDPEDIGEDFRITDCVFIDTDGDGDTEEGEAVAKYFIDFVPNFENFLLEFTLNIPADAPIGDEYCNFAKTTESPSASQASNRKANPACFLIGGALRVTKTDGAGNPLSGADFSISCQWPVSTSAMAATVIAAEPNGSVSDGIDGDTTNDPSETFTSTSGGILSKTATTGSNGTIAVQAPVGTSCTFTETDPPDNFNLPLDPDCTITVVTGQQGTCTFVNLADGKLEVVKNIEPSDDPGRFDLQIDSVTLKDEAADGEGTGEQTMSTGPHIVGETADGETSLSNYTSSINCLDTANSNAAVTATPGTGATWSVSVAPGMDIVCTITNTRQTGKLEVVKNLEPSDDLGRFDLQIEGMTLKDEAADEDSTGEQTLITGTYTVGEIADGETSLSDYASSISCVNTGNADAAVTATPVTATSWDVTVTNGSDIVCRITNSRDTGMLTVIKDLSPSNDAGRFDLLIDSAVEADDVGDGGTTGAVEVNTGSHTVGETAGTNTSLDNYQTSISCLDGATPVTATPGTGTTWSVNVTDDANIVCTILNTRETGTLEVVKDLSPSADAGKFNLQIDGSTAGTGANVGDNGTTGEITLNTGSHTIGETAGTSTSLGNYASSIECRSNNGTGAIVASGSGAGPLPVAVGFGDDIVCVISNARVTVGFDKANDQGDNAAVVPGETIHYTLSVTVNTGTATNVIVTDVLPAGLTYKSGTANPSTGFTVNGQNLKWTVATLGQGTHLFQYDATVNANATGLLTNLGCVDVDQNDALVCDQTTLRVPTLVVDKAASVESITISGPNDALVATPSVVTWTLSFTLANGPVTNAVITDVIPTGFSYVAGSASNSGVFNQATNTLTWTFATLSTSGSVTFQTTVNPATISRTAPTVNTAVIDSNETAPDSGQDSVTVGVEAPPLAGTPTPRPVLPNTAIGIGLDGQPVNVPVELLVAFFIGSLGALALVNVRARSSRR